MTSAASTNSIPRKRQVYLFLIILLLLGYLLVGLYPFRFQSISNEPLHNGVVVTTGHGLQFRSPGIAYTTEAPSWLPLAIATSDLEVTLEVRPANLTQGGPARIFTYSTDPNLRNLTVGQNQGDLILRMRHYYTNLNGAPDYVIDNVFTDTDWHRIRVHITSRTLEVDFDGNTLATAPLPPLHMASWDPGYRVALGNELTGNRPWLGDIRKAVVRVGEETFDYLAPDMLNIPDTYTEVKKRTVKIVPFINDQEFRISLVDWQVNFLIFVPLGWLLALFRSPRPAILFATILAACVSATIEVVQLLYLAERFPSSEDFLMNTLGGAMGAWFAQHYVVSVRRRSA